MATENKIAKNWTYNEGKALIEAYKNRKDEYFRTRNKKHYWNNVLTDLEALDVLVSATTADQVEVKWRSLYRAYKNAKDRGTGSSTSKFLFFNEMDELFQNNPIISSPHSVSVGMVNDPEPAPMASKDKSKKPRRDTSKKVKETALELKRSYYNQKIKEREKKRELLENYLEKKEKAKEERHRELLHFSQNSK